MLAKARRRSVGHDRPIGRFFGGILDPVMADHRSITEAALADAARRMRSGAGGDAVAERVLPESGIRIVLLGLKATPLALHLGDEGAAILCRPGGGPVSVQAGDTAAVPLLAGHWAVTSGPGDVSVSGPEEAGILLVSWPVRWLRRRWTEQVLDLEAAFDRARGRALFDAMARDVAQLAWDETTPGRPFGAAAAQVASEMLILRLARTATGRQGAVDGNPRLLPSQRAAVIDYMRANLCREVTLDQLAATIGMGRYELARRFRAAVGEAPYRHFLRMRAEAARDALVETRESTVVVAERFGYASASEMGAQFRRFLGRLPSAFQPMRSVRKRPDEKRAPEGALPSS